MGRVWVGDPKTDNNRFPLKEHFSCKSKWSNFIEWHWRHVEVSVNSPN